MGKLSDLSRASCVALMISAAAAVSGQCTLAQSSGPLASNAKHGLKFSDCLALKGEIVMSDGVVLGTSTICASDGARLTVFYNSFEDSRRVVDAFNKELATAVKIIKRGNKHDPSGKVVGERAEVLFPGNKPDESVSAVVWTDGRMLREIRSDSMRDTLALEKVYK